MNLLHMGALHPIETILVLLLAFGPFVALAVVVIITRRRDHATERDQPHDEATPDGTTSSDPVGGS